MVSCSNLLSLPKKSPADSFSTSLRLLESFPKGIFSPKEHAQPGHWAGGKSQGVKNEEQDFTYKYLTYFSLQWDSSVLGSALSLRVHCRIEPQCPINYLSTLPLLSFFPSLSHSLGLQLCFLRWYAK